MHRLRFRFWHLALAGVMVLVGVGACSKSSYEAQPASMNDMVAPASAPYPVDAAPPAPSGGSYGSRGRPDMAEKEVRYQKLSMEAHEGGSGANEPPPPPEVPQEAAPKRMVHYDGYLKLRVVNTAESLTAATAKVVALGGFVERLGSNEVTLRVPVAHFDQTMQDLAQMGEVVDRTMSAADVTDAYMSVDLRLRTARETRDRLSELLARAQTEQEKLQLLREIQRLTDVIESLEIQVKTLQDLADLSRITLQVEPRLPPGSVSADNEIAGFRWIRKLTPFARTPPTKERVELTVPEGLVLLSEKGPYVVESPDGAVMWTSVLDNTPRGDTSFWFKAVQSRLASQFAAAEVLELGDFQVLRLVDRSATPYTWIVAIRVTDKGIQLVQVYFPTGEIEKRYQARILESIKKGEGGAS